MTEHKYTFGKDQRLRKKTEFDAVFAKRRRAFEGPLGVYVLRNGLAHSRLGIAMSRKVGTAPRRNRIKRLVRESFRLQQHQLPSGWDIIVVPKAHEPMELEAYMAAMRRLIEQVTKKKTP